MKNCRVSVPANIDLPPRRNKSWVAWREAAVVIAPRSGAIYLEEACRWYEASEEDIMPGSGELRPSVCPDCGSFGCKYTVIRPCSDRQSRDNDYCARRNRAPKVSEGIMSGLVIKYHIEEDLIIVYQANLNI